MQAARRRRPGSEDRRVEPAFEGACFVFVVENGGRTDGDDTQGWRISLESFLEESTERFGASQLSDLVVVTFQVEHLPPIDDDLSADNACGLTCRTTSCGALDVFLLCGA